MGHAFELSQLVQVAEDDPCQGFPIDDLADDCFRPAPCDRLVRRSAALQHLVAEKVGLDDSGTELAQLEATVDLPEPIPPDKTMRTGVRVVLGSGIRRLYPSRRC